MEQHSEKRRVQELIEEYNRQLISTYQQRPKAPPKPPETSWLDEHYPLPDIERDRAAMTVAATESAEQVPTPDDTPSPPNIAPSPYVGYLRVFVFTGQSAEPLQGATVSVSREQDEQITLYATTTTDIDGFTPVLPLPSVDPALTMRPDGPTPYITYDIRVDAIGFQPVIYENVPIYGNNYVTQSASMLPLVPGQNPSIPRVFRSGAPTNL